ATTGAAAPAAPAAAPAAPAATTAPLPLPVAEQLGARLVGLGQLPPGHHVLTVPLDPLTLGEARVVAHITPEGVRIELFGASDATREALKQSLTDLRRDLQDAGLPADVDLGGSDASARRSSDEGSQDATSGGRSTGAPAEGTATRTTGRPDGAPDGTPGVRPARPGVPGTLELDL
ncbi:flagellar hook-length control protein FliK, partial [Cellulomonas endophytica]|uniref:flagellar hook-length control protein FliK n=1 Tax=Cellulomonas endophytica TaxID=2494735 RepID=UPI0013E915B3